ncbi:hypothetical protein CHCC20441_3898 [Bacillus licheniformis]|nr:hypothetical protein CHH93_11960 [Bacillus licheniformis]RIV03046.1 hypothetical protein D1862_05650 [Bacillus licheniformis]TWJ43145.1 hypothetical protein CHCC5025_3674 [Bacillus licheniformis]TWK06325.1 hypothetical protein CHCC20441_3898 [Bacillus licheniformis]TWK17876.1 hypothetical protein CHCC20440_3056 [Bacillus licheniformis]
MDHPYILIGGDSISYLNRFIIDNLDVIEARLDELYTYLENTNSDETWERTDMDLIFALMKIKEIKNDIS